MPYSSKRQLPVLTINIEASSTVHASIIRTATLSDFLSASNG